ncbi:MAG: nicotinate phosphoribosyltransferase [Nostoc sp. JL23]|nr:nicotinate phosphoribosyltransferase [Nostoc sp. JL23]
MQYVAQAVTKIFAPTNDQYPAIGVQPFTGESADKKKQNH